MVAVASLLWKKFKRVGGGNFCAQNVFHFYIALVKQLTCFFHQKITYNIIPFPAQDLVKGIISRVQTPEINIKHETFCCSI